MSTWKGWMQKAITYLQYKAGYDKGYQEGQQKGMFEAAMFVTMMNKYGGIEYIPTRLILEAMPSRGTIIIKQQALKLVTLRLRELVELMDQPPIDETISLIVKFLEYDETLTAEEAEAIDRIVDSLSYFSNLIFLAIKLDGLNMEAMLDKLHLPENKQYLALYYSYMKNEYFVVR